jgi:hypothetical protein
MHLIPMYTYQAANCTLPAKDEHDPDDPTEEDDMGGVPMSYGNVPTSYVRGKRDQTEFEEPEDPTGTVIPQPTAIEFDEV